jgi:glucokinase
LNGHTIIGVDLGGTNTRLGVLEGDRLYDRRSFETRSYRPRDEILGDIVQAVRSLQEEATRDGLDVRALGIGVPSTIDLERGETLVMPNFAEGWRGFPIVAALGERTGLPTALVNDARAFVLAESSLGAGRGYKHVFGIILGTGVGGGAVIGGSLHLGHRWLAGELGHHIVDPHGPRCGCGSYGCLETLASAPALVAAVTRSFLHGRTPLLFKLSAGDLNALSAELIVEAARRGDEACLEAIRRLAYFLGVATANVLTLLDPERVIVGGGLANAHDLLFPAIQEAWQRHARVVGEHLPALAVAELGGSAGVIGAALYARSSFEEDMRE